MLEQNHPNYALHQTAKPLRVLASLASARRW